MNLYEHLADPDRRAREATRIAEDVERRAQEAWSWATNCGLGRCVYANPPSKLPGACQGYLGVKCVEHGVPLMRWRRCDRYFVWHREKIAKEQAEKTGKKPPKSWGE